MTFLNLFMLFGAAAAAVPLIIHLLNRSKFEIVDWGAMHLLQAVIEENNRRIKIYEFLLLLIRCLIPIVLALCLARPLVNQFAVGGSRGNVETLVIVDDSISMSHRDGTETTRLKRATDMVEDLRERLGGDATITPFPDSQSWPPSTFSGSFDLRQHLMGSLNKAAQDRNVAYEILVFSDFQSAGLASLDEASIREIDALRAGIPKKPSISFLPVRASVESEAAANLIVSRVDVDSSRIIRGESLSIVAELVNQSSKPTGQIPVQLLVDDVVVASQEIELAANATRPVIFDYVFSDAPLDPVSKQPQDAGQSNDVLLTVRCQISDDNDHDNLGNQVVTLVSPIRTAVVPNLGRSSIDRDEKTGETSIEFLSVALSPYAFSNVVATSDSGRLPLDRISAVKIPGKRLLGEDLTGFDVLVLVDPAELDQETISKVRQFVSLGGGLLIFAGPRLETAIENWNAAVLHADDGWLTGSVTRLEAGKEFQATIRNARFTHPTLQIFNDGDSGGLTEANIERWVVIGGLQEDSVELASLSSGAPLAVETSLGLGTIIFCATSADTRWSNLPLRPAYLPIVQRWVEYLANRTLPSKYEPSGTPAVFQIGEAFDIQNAKLQGPAGSELPVDGLKEETLLTPTQMHAVPEQLEQPEPLAGSESRLVYTDTRAAGVYRLTMPERSDQLFISVVADDEYQSPLTGNEPLAALSEQLGAELAFSIEQYFSARVERALGIEIWHWVWWCVLGLLIAERVVVWMLGRIA